MQDYIEYTYYDDTGDYIAIIKENTPLYVVEELKQLYDEVKYKEE